MALVSATNPPPVQMHSPGFEVRELPVSLNNINNVRHRPDGRLVAVGSDGCVWLLSDTDGDGGRPGTGRAWIVGRSSGCTRTSAGARPCARGSGLPWGWRSVGTGSCSRWIRRGRRGGKPLACDLSVVGGRHDGFPAGRPGHRDAWGATGLGERAGRRRPPVPGAPSGSGAAGGGCRVERIAG